MFLPYPSPTLHTPLLTLLLPYPTLALPYSCLTPGQGSIWRDCVLTLLLPYSCLTPLPLPQAKDRFGETVLLRAVRDNNIEVECGAPSSPPLLTLPFSPSPSHPPLLTLTFSPSPSHPHLLTLTFSPSHLLTLTFSPSHPHLLTLTFSPSPQHRGRERATQPPLGGTNQPLTKTTH